MSRPREAVRRFACFGGEVTVHVGGRAADGTDAPLGAVLAQGRLLGLHRRLSRFDPASELSLLNADPSEVVHASRLLRRLARAAIEAGERSGGLVDATLVGALERAGYGASRAGVAGLELADLLAARP
ncbi:MAG: ApbE family, partial [Solirubrobacteraceae bacterium]|nr:ApbE family [Solirubrobacteraceae bacterium]